MERDRDTTQDPRTLGDARKTDARDESLEITLHEGKINSRVCGAANNLADLMQEKS